MGFALASLAGSGAPRGRDGWPEASPFAREVAPPGASARRMIAVVDVGIGNLRSVTKALELVTGRLVGQPVVRTADPAALRDAARVVLPGVGAFGDFMAALGRARVDEAVHDVVARGIPLLGVCVGMQALLDESEEFGTHRGLGLIRGRVTRFPPGDLPVPHAGWSPVTARGPDDVLGGGGWYYFVHSYRAEGVDDADVAGTADYLGPFPAVVRRGSARGVQFHPEKSQAAGLALLERFARVGSPRGVGPSPLES